MNINEEVIITSDEHPFYVVGKGFVPAKALKPNDLVFNIDFKLLTVVSNKRIEQSMQMYNFEVEDFHTYAVSGERVWVHNACIEDAVEKIGEHAFKSHPNQFSSIDEARQNVRYLMDGNNPSVTVKEFSDGKRYYWDNETGMFGASC